MWTAKFIRDTLIEFGIEANCIKECTKTGMYVDIEGSGPAEKEGDVSCIALRADTDGLPMPENNPGLEYKTKTGYAHMCGHDGHMATLLCTAKILQKNRDKIPTGRKIRLLFQPGEEGPGGALPMIKEGCLEGVDEVYGWHNIPNFDEGDIRVVEGPIFACSTTVEITVNRNDSKADPVTAVMTMINSFHTIKAREIDSEANIVFSICAIEPSESSFDRSP